MPKPSVREKLVETALERFQEQGFNGCGVQDITDAAGVPKGSFYNHFKSKEALALEVLDRYRLNSRFDILADVAKSPITRLRAHFEFMADRVEGWKFTRGCLLGNFSCETADTSPAMREAMADAFARWCAMVAELLRQAQAQGEIAGSHDPVAVATFLVHAWEGAIAGAKVDKSRVPLEDFFAVTFSTLLVKPSPV
jgi:TetR/AcrR family transcriptional regulator, transcriptional repressor for nem operon